MVSIDFLRCQISGYRHAKDIQGTDKPFIVQSVVKAIAGPKYKDITTQLRATAKGSQENYDIKSSKFPAVTWSCMLKTRNKDVKLVDKLIKHSGLICLDIDKLTSDQLDFVKDLVKEDPHTFILFTSPNGDGVKIVIKIDIDTSLDNQTIIRYHHAFWQQLKSYYLECYDLQIDNACKNVDRLCFLPHDEQIFVNEDSEVFCLAEPLTEPEPAPVKVQPETIITDYDKKDKHVKRLFDKVASTIHNAADGEKLDALLKMAELMGGYVQGGFLSTDEAINFLKTLIENKPNVKSLKVAYKAIEDALEHGKLRPITIEQKDEEYEEWLKKSGNYTTIKPSSNSLKGSIVIEDMLTDSSVIHLAKQDERGDAELLSNLCKGAYLYDHTAGKWMIYQNGVWLKDETGQARKEMINRLIEIYLQVSKRVDTQVSELSKSTPDPDKIKQHEKDRDFLRSRVKQLNRRSRMDNVMNLATSYLPATTNDFDKNTYLLNLLNGTYNFRTNQFKSHSAEDMLSKQALIEYDSKVSCKAWYAFLELVFNEDQELISFIQRCVGYSLTGLTDLQALLFCHGSGANGKSTFFAVIKMLLGDYYCTIPIDTILVKQHDSTAEYQLAKMKGARVVVASEIPEGRKLHESQVKDLTGGEMVNARNPYEKPFSFVPTHKLWMFGNHKPIIKGTDHGIWRRILLIPFSVTIPEAKKRDMSEVLEEMRSELPGILNWAITGYCDYKQNGLNPPDIVKQETDKYKTESDVLSSFFEDRCKISPALFCTAKALYAEYVKWCEEEKETPALRSSKKMIEALTERGYAKFNGTGNAVTIQGIDIKPPN